MADISSFLQKILDAVYGEEVRGSIHDALSAMNKESSSAMEFAATAKDSATASAEKAKSEAQVAAQKATEAWNSAERALQSEQKALESGHQAVDAAGRAQESETNAANSETETIRNALSASSAKDAAEAAKLVAEQAKDAAWKSAKDAADSATKAEQYSGKPPMPQNGTWWIWNAETGEYYDTKISCELRGPIGIGIDDIQLTSGDHSPGTTDIYTVLLTDGSSYTISVYNGLNGTGAGDVLGISFDLVIPASGWKDGSITIADNRLLALATHKYFLSADEACKEKFIDCNVQPKDITTTGFITFTNETDPAMDLTVNLIRFELSGNGAIQ